MSKITIYFKVFGLAEDENGNPDWCGIKTELGTFAPGKEIPYSELVKKVNLSDLLAFVCLDKIGLGETDAEIITPEEYERDYGDDEDDE